MHVNFSSTGYIHRLPAHTDYVSRLSDAKLLYSAYSLGLGLIYVSLGTPASELPHGDISSLLLNTLPSSTILYSLSYHLYLTI